MKKIINLWFLLFWACIAYANERVYCPEWVECLQEDIAACTFEQGTPAYWLPISHVSSELFQAGKYRVSYVSAPYDINDGGYAICVYTHTEIHQALMLRARPDAFLIIAEDETSAWRHEESWGECRPEPLWECPLMTPD